MVTRPDGSRRVTTTPASAGRGRPAPPPPPRAAVAAPAAPPPAGPRVSGRADGGIGWTTAGCVALLALIAATVSYLHMHMLVGLHGQPGWVAALTPFSVDGMIVAASTTRLADSRSGGRGGILPWTLLVVGSVASLAANGAIPRPTAAGRVVAACPSVALIHILTHR